MAYDLWLDGGTPPVRVSLADSRHDLLADAIVRGAGAVRLLRRIVDLEREARFLPAEVPGVLHEITDLRGGLGGAERDTLAADLDRVAGLFEAARAAGRGVAGAGAGK